MGGAERDLDETEESVGQSPNREERADQSFWKVRKSEDNASSENEDELFAEKCVLSALCNIVISIRLPVE